MAVASPIPRDLVNSELETILTSFDSCYVWNYGTVKEGLRDLYEKAKREQWNSTTQLAWQTDVDCEGELIPSVFNPLAEFATTGFLNVNQAKDAPARDEGWQKILAFFDRHA